MRGTRATKRSGFLIPITQQVLSEEELSRWGPFGLPEHVAEKLQKFREAGCRVPILRLVTWDPIGQLRLCMEEVLPRLRVDGLMEGPAKYTNA